MKYVITDYNHFAMGSGCFHDDLAAALTGKVIGAGHVEFLTSGLKVSGKSVGFNMEAKAEDAVFLSRQLGVPIAIDTLGWKLPL